MSQKWLIILSDRHEQTDKRTPTKIHYLMTKLSMTQQAHQNFLNNGNNNGKKEKDIDLTPEAKQRKVAEHKVETVKST